MERRESRQLLVPAVGSRSKTVDVRSVLQASSCDTWPFAVCTSGSIDRSTILHAIGHREGSVSYVEESSWAGHNRRRQGIFREGLREVEGHWVWATGTERKFDSARRCNSCASMPSATVTRRRELSSSNRVEKSTNTPGSADSLLRHVEITGDFDCWRSQRRRPLSCLWNRQQSRSTHVPRTK